MRVIDHRRMFSASDLMRFQSCRYATWLDLRALEGDAPERAGEDPEAALLQDKGDAHETAFLAKLEAKHRVHRIETKRASFDQAVEATRDAMRKGAPVIFQGALRRGTWGGYTDFLERVERPSDLGPYSYEVVDTKLKRSPDPKHVLQLVLYSDMLAHEQGLAPRFAHLELGSAERTSIRLDDVADYARRVRDRFEAFTANPKQVRPEPVAACAMCGWRDHCAERWEAEESLTLVAGITRSQRAKLEKANVTTLSLLAANEGSVAKLAPETLEKLRIQARLQAARRAGGQPAFELKPAEAGKGFDLLPRPDEGDLFYDIEGDPHVEGGLEYLHGFWLIEDGRWRFKAVWAHDRSEECEAVREVIAFLADRMGRHPQAHIYHYAPYEVTALRRLAASHRVGEDALDDLLRGRRFVDLYKVVRGALYASESGYSLKDLEAFYMEARDGTVATAGGSVVAYEAWRDTGDPALLEEIRDYNEDDVRSTKLLRDWLIEAVRPAEHRWPEGQASQRIGDDAAVVPDDAYLALEARCAPLAAILGERPARLVVDLNVFHTREKKPAWWTIFDKMGAEDEALIDDLECLGGLSAVGPGVPLGRGRMRRIYRVPEQETKLRTGDQASVVRDPMPASVTLETYDPHKGIAVVVSSKRAGELEDRINLLPGSPINTKVLERGVKSMTQALLEEASFAEPLRRFLMREVPQFNPQRDGAIIQAGDDERPAAISKAVAEMHASTLAIQGPPGTGKTYVSARSILDLIKAGRRVAVSSNSHKAIENLLSAVCSQAEAEGLTLLAAHKLSDAAGEPRDPRIVRVTDNDDERLHRADVIGGTAWLFARYSKPAFSHLFVDEAGQVSLANLMAMAGCAENLVLVGDPMQLPQPIQGAHPGDSGRSCLEYYLGDARVAPSDLAIFLPTTRRLHPGVCDYISKVAYEGALVPDAGASRRRVLDAFGTPLSGAKLVSIDHTGRSQTAPEEAEAIQRFIGRCLGGWFTDRDGSRRAITLDDILVVAPYNAQVNALTAALPEGARVGTVDKFQGQEAPICLVSMATSSSEELPRDIEFLFSLNRINVAVSRAMVCSRVFASPRLLDTPCRTLEQMKLVNALCALELEIETRSETLKERSFDAP